MSYHYIIRPYLETTWQIDSEMFMQALQRKYPQIELTPITNVDDPFLLDFEVNGPNGNGFRGMLNKDRQGIILRAGLEESAEFAVWFQILYPDIKILLFFDEMFSFDVPLYGHTVEQVVGLARQGYSHLMPERSIS